MLYVDQDFLPDDASLGVDLAGLACWRRPGDFHGTSTSTSLARAAFGGYGKPLPSDLRPCPFAVDASLACAIAALAERPRFVSTALCGRSEIYCGIIRGGGGVDAGGRCSLDGGAFRRNSDDALERGEGQEKQRNGVSGEGKPKRGSAAPKRFGAMAAAAATEVAAKSGIFSTRLCVGGIWKEFVMDDYFPCHADRSGNAGGPCLSRAHGSALWVSMLEKAYARVVGSYTAALGGCFLPELDTQVVEGAGDQAGSIASTASSVVARPAKVLAVFTGAPVLQMTLAGSRGKGETRTMPEGEQETVDAMELWGRIVRCVSLAASDALGGCGGGGHGGCEIEFFLRQGSRQKWKTRCRNEAISFCSSCIVAMVGLRQP